MKLSEKFTLGLVTAISFCMIGYHMLYTQLVLLGPTQHQNLHLLFALTLVYLWSFYKGKNSTSKLISLVLLGLSIYATCYIFWEYDNLEQVRGPLSMLTTQDVVVGTLIVGLSLEASRRAFGCTFPMIALCFITYCLFGHLLPDMIAAPDITYMEMIAAFVMGLAGGIYGNTMGVSANYIFLFVVFGALLSATGASRFFARLGVAAGRHMAGGPAISAVISSALMGSITGSALANVATTGTFTIPLMKKAGYKPYQAGAIEAAASTGGQIMPPVMGATAFVLAEMANVPYVEVMTAALIPAALYFLSVGFYAQLQAKKLKISSEGLFTEPITFKLLMQEAPLFLGPLFTIMLLLYLGYSPMFTVFWAIVILLAINFVCLIRQGKLTEVLPSLVPEIREGAITGSKIAVTCAVLGPIVAVMTKTSLGIRIPSIIAFLSGGNVIVALIITALVCILLGMGVPTLAAYLMVAMVGVPVLVTLGIPVFAAHMYVFIFAVFSCITPPVATAAIPAAGIADSPYMRTAFEAAKVGSVGFIIPFFCVFSPEIMIGQSDVGVLGSCIAALWVLVAILLICMSFCGYSFRVLPMHLRLVAAGVSFLMTMCMFMRAPWLICTAGALCVAFFGYEAFLHFSNSASRCQNSEA